MASPQGPLHIRSVAWGTHALDNFLAREPSSPPASVGNPLRSIPIKRSSSAQAGTRTKQRAAAPPSLPRGGRNCGHPPFLPIRPTRHAHSDLLQIILEEGDPSRDSLPISCPYVTLVSPTSPWSRMGRNMIGVYTPSESIISSTLISPERYEWLYATHSRLAHSEA